MLKPVKPRSNPATERSRSGTGRPNSAKPGAARPIVSKTGASRATSSASDPAHPVRESRGTRPSRAAMPASPERKLAPSLTPGGNKALRAQAHHLDPVVMIGEAGLSPAVIVEIERALVAHELIKIRIFGDDRDQRAEILQSISQQCGCVPVQMIGKLLVVWRPNAEKAPPKKSAVAGKARPERAGTARFKHPERKPFGESPPLRRPANLPIARVTKLRGAVTKVSPAAEAPPPKPVVQEQPLRETDMREPGTRYVPQRPLPETGRVRPASTPRSPSLSRPKKPAGKVQGVSLLRKVTRNGH